MGSPRLAVGDTADGYPGLPGFGAKSAAAVLRKFEHIEAIAADHNDWQIDVRNCYTLAQTLSDNRDLALLFKTLATLRDDAELFDDVEQLRWNGPTAGFAKFAESIRIEPTVGGGLTLSQWGSVVILAAAVGMEVYLWRVTPSRWAAGFKAPPPVPASPPPVPPVPPPAPPSPGPA